MNSDQANAVGEALEVIGRLEDTLQSLSRTLAYKQLPEAAMDVETAIEVLVLVRRNLPRRDK